MGPMKQEPAASQQNTIATSFSLGDRTRGDACPGALKMHEATDGKIGRIRFPGGKLTPAQLLVMAQLAEECGDGNIHVTSRGNVQVRGISEPADFSDQALAAGLVPSLAHDRMRNILADPRDEQMQELAQLLDQALLANEEVAGLPGRTLFALDAGNGRLASRRPDFGVIRSGADEFHLILGGHPAGFAVAAAEVAPTIVALAARWQQQRGTSWRLQENRALTEALADQVLAALPAARQAAVPEIFAELHQAQFGKGQVGWSTTEQELVVLEMGLPFGVLPAVTARALAGLDQPVYVTPWASLVVKDLAAGVAESVVNFFAPRGLVFDENSPWLRVTACTGLPGCDKAKSDVRADAVQLIEQGLPAAALPRIHFVGCERRCGHPLVAYTEYLATGDGEYETNEVVPTPGSHLG